MSKFDEFYQTHINKGWNKYGKEYAGTSTQWYEPFGGQCVSLIMTYLRFLFGDRVQNSYGNAIDFWTGRETNKILELCTAVSTPQDGDIVVSSGSLPQYGHIWIYKGGQAFSQNVLDDPRALLYPLSWQGQIYGVLRPKELTTQPTVKPIVKEKENSVYRLYNQASGDHLYTLSHDEAVACQKNGWKYESVGWVAPKDGELVMRLCNPFNGMHHYTANTGEIEGLKKLGWKLEGAAFRSGGKNPVYRMYNPNGGEHIFTASAKEHADLSNAGWVCEGVGFKF